jgi:organic hydroperoxide reductase OsmC/OhrA
MTTAMARKHHYAVDLLWTGNLGEGTATARSYSRAHEVAAIGVGTIVGSSDPAFRGDASRWNPEQLLVASVAQCHMLWYLGLAADGGIVVTHYEDHPTAIMNEESSGAGQFEEVALHPIVTVADPMDAERALRLHDEVHRFCFIARSVNFPIHHEATVR